MKFSFYFFDRILLYPDNPVILLSCLTTEAVLKFLKRNTETQQHEAVVQGRSLSPYRLRYKATLKFPKRNTQAQQREAVVQGRSLQPYRLRYTISLRE
ncbi:MAG: hypothetical protein LBJ00_04020 [Planctomycetaceae bacterium]|nr:hypothetical protein [Planctomycetaceae bacterium]